MLSFYFILLFFWIKKLLDLKKKEVLNNNCNLWLFFVFFHLSELSIDTLKEEAKAEETTTSTTATTMNTPNSSSRNESFINTASKLLEKAKQNHLNHQIEDSQVKSFTLKSSTEFVQPKPNLTTANLYKTNEEVIQN